MGCTACTEPQCLYKGALYLSTFICRVRRAVEKAFGNLAARCRVYAKPVDVKPRATDLTIKIFVLAQLAANYIGC